MTRTSSAKSTKAQPSPRPFERVWQLILRIPRGRVATYGQLSALIDRRLTPVGVGWAIRAAPDGALPWHRVVNASGGISTDGEHLGLQRAMLEAEGVRFDERGCVDLEKVGWHPRVTPPRGRSKATSAKARQARKRRGGVSK